MSRFFLWIALWCSFPAHASWYLVLFKDKGQNIFCNPESFLSEQGQHRRIRLNIPFDNMDIGICRNYVEALISIAPQEIHVSKWLNVQMLQLTPEQCKQVRAFPFVKDLIGIQMNFQHSASFDDCPENKVPAQNQQLGIQDLHQYGWQGQGIRMAILDDGFRGALQSPFFQNVFQNGQVAHTRNFLNGDPDVFSIGGHGTATWSQIASSQEPLIGAAPKATYFLARTELDSVEIPLEMMLWVEAAEWADSLGADIISSSLGYSQFDNPLFDYYYADMDGKTTLVSKGAAIAFQKGILVVNSAGNEGQKPWRYILAPADAREVLAVGATDAQRQLAPFSSRGPSWDGRIKPDLVAMGAGNLAVFTNGALIQANGTSFSCPLMAGLAACIWQTQPQLTATQLKEKLIESGDRFLNPNNDEGYGMPNARLAYFLIHQRNLTPAIPCHRLNPEGFLLYPNPIKDQLFISGYGQFFNAPEIFILNTQGQIIWKGQWNPSPKIQTQMMDWTSSPGIYWLRIMHNQSEIYSQRFLVMP